MCQQVRCAHPIRIVRTVKQDVVDQIIDDHLSGRRDRRKLLWTLLMFRWWEQGPFGPGAAKS